MKEKSVMLIGFMPNPRIVKRLELEKNMFDLHLICWDRGKNMLSLEQGEGYETHVIKIKAGGNPVKRMIPYLMFAKKAKKLLNDINPRLIHVQGLDMLKIACDYKKTHPSVKIINEVADLHRFIVDEQSSLLYKFVRKYLNREDRKCAERYNLLVVTSMKYYDNYFKEFIPKEKVMYFPNVPDLSAFEKYSKKNDGEFVVGYIGGVRYKKQIKNLLTAAEKLNIRLMIAGFEQEPLEIEPLCKKNPNIEWVGRFDFNSQVAELYGKCDVMYSVYDADMNNVKVALPNKLYEAVYCGIPLIVAKETYLSQIVGEWGVGVSVDHREPDELINVLEKLKNDKTFYEGFSDNCNLHRSEIDLKKYNDALKAKIGGLINE